MKEPKRLLARGATDFERQLLASVMNERPSALLRSRMQRSLGLVGPLAWASNVKAMLGSLGSHATLGVAALGVVAAGALGAVSLAPTSDVAKASRQAASEVTTTAVAPTPSASRAPPAAAVAEVAPATLELSGADVETLPAASGGSQLRDEIALLDAARSALQKGRRKRALESLKEYDKRFPDGILERESRLLRRHASRGSTPGR